MPLKGRIKFKSSRRLRLRQGIDPTLRQRRVRPSPVPEGEAHDLPLGEDEQHDAPLDAHGDDDHHDGAGQLLVTHRDDIYISSVF